jgi:hypothetical protein
MATHPYRVQAQSVTDDATGARGGPPQQYQIWVAGHLGEMMRSAFPDLQAQLHGKNTVLTGPLPDQAALHGVLAEIETLGLELLEVRRLPPH